jgi:hypothetical protein
MESISGMKYDDELRELVQYLISNIGHPVGMGLPCSDEQADRLIELVRKYDQQVAQQEGEG